MSKLFGPESRQNQQYASFTLGCYDDPPKFYGTTEATRDAWRELARLEKTTQLTSPEIITPMEENMHPSSIKKLNIETLDYDETVFWFAMVSLVIDAYPKAAPAPKWLVEKDKALGEAVAARAKRKLEDEIKYAEAEIDELRTIEEKRDAATARAEALRKRLEEMS